MNVVITGNRVGIGKMISDRLSAQGHRIYGLSRQSEMACHVENWDEVNDWARYLLDLDITVDAIITCAGTQGELGKVVKTDAEKWSETVRVNLDGTYNTIKAFYPLMKDSRRPKIICFAGGGSAYGRPYFSAYAVAKTGVVRLVETFSMEEDVDINAVAPGGIKTDIINGALKAGPNVIGNDEYQKAVKQSEVGDDPTPMLEIVDWLLSDKSDGVTGRFISAKWDDWKNLTSEQLKNDSFRLRRTLL